LGLIEKHNSTYSQINPNVIGGKDWYTLRPSYEINAPVNKRGTTGVIVSRKFVADRMYMIREIAFAATVKQLFRGSMIYDYNPNKLAKMLGMNYNTVKKYVAVLLENNVAIINNGNLVIKQLRRDKSRRSITKVYGDQAQIISQLREFIVFCKLRSQRKAVDYREGIKTASLCRNLREVKKYYKLKRYDHEIFNRKSDFKMRMTINSLMDLLLINSRDAVQFRRSLINNGYGFCYTTTVLHPTCRHYDKSVLPTNSYCAKGRIYQRESWVNF
jgi:hypothetical protein